MLNSFKHITPQSRVFYGPNSLKSLNSELDHAKSTRAMIFCDPFLVQEGTLLKLVMEEIEERCVGIFSNIVPRSPLSSVQEAAAEIQRLEADALIVIGGGSSVVTARSANILACEKKDIHELCTNRGPDGKLRSPKLLAPKLPLLIIPTTPTTAAVKGGCAVLDPEKEEKLSMFDPKVRPHSLFIHPEFVRSAPESLILNAALSTVTCAIDGLMSVDGDPMSDAQLIQALRMLVHTLSDRQKINDVDVRCEMMLAATLCGMGSDYTGFGIAIALGHAICAYYPMRDGYMNAITLPQSMRFNIGYGDGMEKLALAMDVRDDGVTPLGEAVIAKFQSIMDKLPIPKSFSEAGLPKDSIPAIAASTMDDWYLHFNPRPVTQQDIEQIMLQAW